MGRVEFAHVSAFPRHPLKVMTVAADEAPAAFIETQTKLRGAGLRLQMIRERIPREIATIQDLPLHLATIACGGSPKGAVFAPSQAVGKRLDIGAIPSEAGGDDFALISHAIAIVVAREDQVR